MLLDLVVAAGDQGLVIETLLLVEAPVQIGIDAFEGSEGPAALEGLCGLADLAHDAGDQRLADPARDGAARSRAHHGPTTKS